MARGYRRSDRMDDECAEELMESPPTLDRLITAFENYQKSRNLSGYTLRNYASTFKSHRRFCAEVGLAPDANDLSTELFRRYQDWLLATPLDTPRSGSIERRSSAAAARMRQLKAFCTWLYDEGEIERPVKFALPKTPVR